MHGRMERHANRINQPFTVLSDHKNLKHFMTSRRLNERQVRWLQTLSQFNFKIKFRPGKQAARPDALSRRGQDMPQNLNDERLQNREQVLIKDTWIGQTSVHDTDNLNTLCKETKIPEGLYVFFEGKFQDLWNEGIKADDKIQILYDSLSNSERSLPAKLNDIKISLSECKFDSKNVLRFRNRIYIPNYEPLKTALIQQTHDSHITGHPGRDSTLSILSRNFFWPGISKAVRQFCRNCDVCGRSHVWRETRKGLLHPLPIPDRFHSELSIDFMTELPAKTKEDPRYMMVVVDRLTGSVEIEAMTTMKAEDCAKVFMKLHVRHHGFPTHITSDRGTNWVGDFWKELCRQTGMTQRLSTAFHPQTDGATERMNQEILAYLRAFITYTQFDWKDLLACAMLAINNRTSTRLGMSPFYAQHGYNVEPIEIKEPVGKATGASKRATNFVKRLVEAQELAQASMASAQERMEHNANKSRKEADIFKPGDRVWLNLKNIQTPQLSKKLSWLNAKYQVTKVIDSHSVELNTPTGIWPRFHVDLLKRAATDPLPSQIIDHEQPPPVLPQAGKEEENKSTEPEQFVERILRADTKRIGKGHKRYVLVKWKGFAEPTWETRSDMNDTVALDIFEERYGTKDNVGESVGAILGQRKRTKRGLLKDK